MNKKIEPKEMMIFPFTDFFSNDFKFIYDFLFNPLITHSVMIIMIIIIY